MKLIEIAVETDGEAAEAISAVFNRYSRHGAVIEEVWTEPSAAPVVRGQDLSAGRRELCPGTDRGSPVAPGPDLPDSGATVRWLEEAEWADAWKVGLQDIPHRAAPGDQALLAFLGRRAGG